MAHPGDDDFVCVVLEGGSADLPPELRSIKVAAADETVKIQHRGGYEHFERLAGAECGNGDPVVFRWTMRTRIAE